MRTSTAFTLLIPTTSIDAFVDTTAAGNTSFSGAGLLFFTTLEFLAPNKPSLSNELDFHFGTTNYAALRLPSGDEFSNLELAPTGLVTSLWIQFSLEYFKVSS